MSPVFALILLISASASPEQPRWPDLWSAVWSEHSLAHFTKGATAFSTATRSLVWRRDDGAGDEACALALGAATSGECHHLVAGGQRYLYYPVLAQCCSCCSEAQGCGALTPDFLASATFAGEQTYYGQAIYSWEAPTFTYYETQAERPSDRKWVALFAQNVTYTYVSGWTREVDQYALELPKACQGAEGCQSGPCALIRAEKDEAVRHRLISSALQDRFGH